MLSIIVPYRDREDHLKQFIPHMRHFFKDRLINITIVEQIDSKPFNRGRLLNIGAILCLTHTTAPFLCFHDVDMLPIAASYPSTENGVLQHASSSIQKTDYLGGVTIIHQPTFFYKIGGYHNDYFHRAEDNEMMFHLKRLKIPVYHITGTFEQIPHPRSGPEFIPELWQKAQLPRTINMLETCKYVLISKEVHETHTHIKVAL